MNETMELSFHDCCRAIVAASGAKALNYAVRYAEIGLELDMPKYQKVQALYILNNITRWRGDEATAIRAALKQVAGVK